MSTTPVDTWAVDLADVTFIYPWVGWEGVMAIVAIVLWILWHVWQCRFENNTYKEDIEKHATSENLRKATSGEI
ncbi:MAG: hypothetical protein OEM59_14805 [Rhodospirillales bacterium]|nr:hypothetical protein [Rhodospirillales bacterium]